MADIIRRKVAEVLTAVQWMDNYPEVHDFCPETWGGIMDIGHGGMEFVLILTLGSKSRIVERGDYIIKDSNGNFMYCPKDIFSLLFEVMGEV